MQPFYLIGISRRKRVRTDGVHSKVREKYAERSTASPLAGHSTGRCLGDYRVLV